MIGKNCDKKKKTTKKKLWLILSCTGTMLYKSSFIGSAYVILFTFFAKINLSAVIWCKVYNIEFNKTSVKNTSRLYMIKLSECKHLRYCV